MIRKTVGIALWAGIIGWAGWVSQHTLTPDDWQKRLRPLPKETFASLAQHPQWVSATAQELAFRTDQWRFPGNYNLMVHVDEALKAQLSDPKTPLLLNGVPVERVENEGGFTLSVRGSMLRTGDNYLAFAGADRALSIGLFPNSACVGCGPLLPGTGVYEIERSGEQLYRWGEQLSQWTMEVKEPQKVWLRVRMNTFFGTDIVVRLNGEQIDARTMVLRELNLIQIPVTLKQGLNRFEIAADKPSTPIPNDPRLPNMQFWTVEINANEKIDK